jgi:hypothetical protein
LKAASGGERDKPVMAYDVTGFDGVEAIHMRSSPLGLPFIFRITEQDNSTEMKLWQAFVFWTPVALSRICCTCNWATLEMTPFCMFCCV